VDQKWVSKPRYQRPPAAISPVSRSPQAWSDSFRGSSTRACS